MIDRLDVENLATDEREIESWRARLRRPTGRNYWFRRQQKARRAAAYAARTLGPGYTVHHHSYHPGDIRHYHLRRPSGMFIRVHFFYGPHPSKSDLRRMLAQRKELERPLTESEADLIEQLHPGGRVNATVSEPLTLIQAIKRGRGRQGIYKIYKQGHHIYTGQSNNLGQRLAGRLQNLRQFDVDIRPYRIVLETFRSSDAVRKAVEHAKIRQDRPKRNVLLKSTPMQTKSKLDIRYRRGRRARTAPHRVLIKKGQQFETDF